MLAASIFAWARLAAAEPVEPAIRIEGSVRCLTPAGVEARVTSWSERPALPAEARIELVHEPERLRVRVGTGTAAPIERTFSPAPTDCKDAELVAAVAIALALDGLAEAERAMEAASIEEAEASPAPPEPAGPAHDDERPLASSSPSSPSRSTEPLAAGPAERADASRVPSPGDRRPSTSLVLAAGGAARELPWPGFTGGLGTRMAWRALAVTAELELGARTSAPIGSGAGVVDLVRVAASAGPCASFGRQRWSMGLCALALGGPLWARARRTASPRAAVVPWLAAAARSEIAVELSPRWWLGLRSDVLFGVVRPSIVATELPTGRRTRVPTPGVGWRATLAVGLRLGSTRVSGRSSRFVRAPVKRRGSAPMQGVVPARTPGGTEEAM